MRIIETGITLVRASESPVSDCVGFQQIAHQDDKGTWLTDGYELLQYCIRDDVDERQGPILPCQSSDRGRCIWQHLRPAGRFTSPPSQGGAESDTLFGPIQGRLL